MPPCHHYQIRMKCYMLYSTAEHELVGDVWLNRESLVKDLEKDGITIREWREYDESCPNNWYDCQDFVDKDGNPLSLEIAELNLHQ